jgi:proline dehydrogenase
LADLLPLRPSIRLVKGAYNEPLAIAFPKKEDVDENYFALAQELLRACAEGKCARAAFGTHDVPLIRRMAQFVNQQGLEKREFEVQMLYGIQRAEQERLAREGCRSIVLVAYGTYWYPWFVLRLAERPANLWFLLRNVFAHRNSKGVLDAEVQCCAGGCRGRAAHCCAGPGIGMETAV